MSARRRFALLVAAGLSGAPPAMGATKSWINTGGGTYQVGSNWSPVNVPLAGDDLLFTLNDLGYTVSFTGSATASTLTMTNDNVLLDLNGFTLTLTSASSVVDVLGSAGSSGRLDISEGTLDSDAVGSNSNIGTGSTSASINVISGGIWRAANINVVGGADDSADLN